MRVQVWTVPVLALAAAIAPVNAFPTVENLVRMMQTPNGVEKRCPYAELQAGIETALEKRQLVNTNAPIDVSGQHAFQPPDFSNGDQRGPCPGLNVLANHGYIPHNGVVTMNQVIQGTNQVWGMGVDLGTFLAALGTVFVGDALAIPPTFSIGGPSSAVVGNVLSQVGLIGEPRGLDGSHNIIEADSSNTRDDLYVTGNNYALNLTLFQDWMATADKNGIFTMESTAQRAMTRFQESIASNPNFYYGPFTGTIARNAGYFFAQRFFANYSSQNPNGLLTQDIVKSIYAVTGNGANMVYKKGYERLPENWYRRPTDYTLAEFNVDLVYLASLYPELLSIGGNTGTVNSFTGVNLANLTGGLLDATTLLEGNNLICLVMEIVKTLSPNLLSSVYATIAGPLQIINKALNTPITDLSCPAFNDLTIGGQPLWKTLLNEFPGARLSSSPL